MMVNLDRRSRRPILEMSSPSIVMVPDAGSIMRNKPKVKDDLPAPVRPTTPIWNIKKSKLESFLILDKKFG